MNISFGINKKEKVTILEEKNSIIIENDSDDDYVLVANKKFINLDSKQLCIEFCADVEYGKPCYIKMYNWKKEHIHTIFPNDVFYQFGHPSKVSTIICVVPSKSKCTIKKLIINTLENYKNKIDEFFCNDTIVLTPGFPSLDNKYLWSFVHSRVKYYYDNGLNVDVAVPSYEEMRMSEYEGIRYCKLSYFDLREMLQRKKYRNIIVHYFSEQIAQVLSSVSLENVNVYIYSHSGDMLYRDLDKLSVPYFDNDHKLPQEEYCKLKDWLIEKFNNRKNIKFIFPTQWAKERAEFLNNTVYTNCEVLTNPIDESKFDFEIKTPDKRKKVVIIRKYDNISTYGIDLNVKCILELSKKDYFNELTFSVYGDGDYHDVLLKPLEQFDNVHIHKRFLSHDEMNRVFKEAGIAVFGTRYETQGVAAAEAALAGLVVISNDVCAVSQVFDKKYLSPHEDYVDMANKIDYYYNNPDVFVETSKDMHEQILRSCASKDAVNKELSWFKDNDYYQYDPIINLEDNDDIWLSVVVPSYNAQQWLKNGVESLIRSKYNNHLEVLIVNDGSKDNTPQIGEYFANITRKNGRSIVKVINKENGGHGSTINSGLAVAKGKYIKIMDADDYFDTDALDELMIKLQHEDSDIVLTDYIEDWSTDCHYNFVRNYRFMSPGKQYAVEDLCYEGYGFNRYANILHTSTYKTDMLRNANIKISEKCFYVDMEMNTYGMLLCKTITYYPISLYVYYLGRAGQSVSPASFKRNFKQHEHVVLKIVDEIDRFNASKPKKSCLYRTIVIPMIETQLHICKEYLKDKKELNLFIDKLKAFPDIYNDKRVISYIKKYTGN